MRTETLPFDAAQYLREPEAQAELMADALESGDATYIATALGTIARARGITEVARGTGVTRAALYKALGPSGDPRLTTFLGVLNSLGFKLTLKPEDAEAA
jgi:probable addiction module antidote protein